MKVQVCIREVLEKIVTYDVSRECDAIDMAKDSWKKGETQLDYNDFKEVEYSVISAVEQ